MNSEDIKKILKQKRIKIVDIANDLGVSQPTVSLTIKGTTVSAKVRTAIAQAIGKPVEKIWPDSNKAA